MKSYVLLTSALVLVSSTSLAQGTTKLTPVQQRAAGVQTPTKQVQPSSRLPRNVNSVPAYRLPGAAPQVAIPMPPAPLVGGTDDCVTPDVIVGTGSFAFDNTLATTGTIGQFEGLCNQLGAGTAILNDVWFTWTAPTSGVAILETCNVTGVDTKIAAYDGATCPVNPTLACNDDNCSFTFQSKILWPVVAGNAYLIQFGNYPGNFPPATPGTGIFNLSVQLPPTNDDCSTPIAISGTGTTSYDNTLASTNIQGQSETLCNIFGSTAINNDIWYSWTATFSGYAEVTSCGGFNDTKISIFGGTGCPAGSSIACSDDFCGAQSRVTFPCIAGQTYTIQLGDGPFAFAPGADSFTVNVGVPPPAEDSCTTPIAISGLGSFPFDNTNATTGIEGQTEPACTIFGTSTVNNDVWYDWTATHTGTAAIETCTSFVDTKIAVYAGVGCPIAGSALACNDDACGLQTRTIFPVVAGQHYTIQLGLYPFTQLGGPGNFDMIVVIPPSNDDCSTPTTIATTSPLTWDNTFASTGSQGQNETLCFNAGSTNLYLDVWYTWTATFTGTAGARTCNTTFVDTRIAVYDGSGCPANAAIACVDDACFLQTLVTFPCVAGQQYTLQLGTFNQNDIGQGGIDVFDAAPPVNDDCTAAIAVGTSIPTAFDNTFATTGAQGQNEALCFQVGGTAINNDIWYTWVAPSSGQFQVQTLGLTTVDTKIGVYDGAGCPATSAIGCNDDANDPNAVYLQSAAPFTAVAGQTYTIQLGLYQGTIAGGAGEFTVEPVGVPTNDDCAAPFAVTGFGPHFFDNSQATTGIEGQAEVLCDFYQNTAVVEDVWFTWNGNSSGTATLTFCGSTSTDTKVSVYDGTGCPVGSSLTCIDDSCNFQSEVQFPVTCGQTYTIQIGCYPNYFGPAGGQGRFTVDVTGGAACFTGTIYCPGDGSGTACPCGNNSSPAAAAGCLNSLGAPGTLRGSGTSSISADTLVLASSQIPNGPGLYFQGTTQPGSGNGVLFGDGLRCAGGTVIRLGIVQASSNSSTYPSPNPPATNAIPIGAKGLNVAGNVRNYQLWYRDSPSFCTAAVFNLTNALNLTWTP